MPRTAQDCFTRRWKRWVAAYGPIGRASLSIESDLDKEARHQAEVGLIPRFRVLKHWVDLVTSFCLNQSTWFQLLTTFRPIQLGIKFIQKQWITMDYVNLLSATMNQHFVPCKRRPVTTLAPGVMSNYLHDTLNVGDENRSMPAGALLWSKQHLSLLLVVFGLHQMQAMLNNIRKTKLRQPVHFWACETKVKFPFKAL